MLYTNKQALQELQTNKSATGKSTTPGFADQRISTSIQLKQQAMMHAADSSNVVQQHANALQLARRPRHTKPPVLPGKKKRLRQAQDDDLLKNLNKLGPGSDEVIDEDRTVNYWDALGVESEDKSLKTAEVKKSPTEINVNEGKKLAEENIEALLKKGYSPALSIALKAKYGDDLGGQMSRQMRIKPITNEQELKKQAENKLRSRENDSLSESNMKEYGSGTLNTKNGKPVPGLKKGIGQGFAAGDPGLWHVHFDHVKFGSNNNTRIDFSGRTRQAIITNFTTSYPQPAPGSGNRASWDICHQWMQKNL